MIHVTINGELRTIPDSQSVLDLLRELGLEPARVAVELDRHILKQPRWADTLLRNGAQLEIVQFVGGG